MKGIQGLILAIGLGIAGAMFNWAYLTSKAKEVELEHFVCVKSAAIIERGDRIDEQQLTSVGIPKEAVGNLASLAVLWSERQTIIGRNVWRTIPGGSLILQEDYRTPPQELTFGAKEPGSEERAMWVPVDTRTFVPALVVPGDLVSFVVPKYQASGPTPATAGALVPKPAAGQPVSGTEIIGPFKILSLGNRLGSMEVMRAAKITQMQENVMTVSVKVVNDQLEPKAQRLYQVLAANYQQVAVLLHPRPTSK